MRPANGRAHLSIGEVLSLLQDEFPDVTISKIRFLESQGLLDPERTPSGYRKFYNADIERLRWILRQQKEHYLPLRVIKDKLDQAGGEIPEDDEGLDPAAAVEGQQRLPTAGARGAQGGGQGDRGGGATAAPAAPPGDPAFRAPARNGTSITAGGAPLDPPDDGATRPQRSPLAPGPPERWMDSSWPEEPPLEVNGLSRPQVLPAPPPRPEPPLSRGRRSDQQRAADPPGVPVQEHAVEAEPRAHEPPRQPSPRRTGAVPAEPATRGTPRNRPTRSQPPGRRGAPPGATAEHQRGRRDPVSSAAGLSDVSLTVDELAEASGLSVRDIRDLEKFGLVERVGDDGKQVYDGDALVVAHTAAGFLQHGIEARHLRAYKVAIEREAGLFEQIVLPVLKQRNPEARQRAARTVTELIRLGEVMRGVLLRRELRDHMGGS